MPRHFTARMNRSRGQSLVETALMVPLLIMIVLNVVNLGYFFLLSVNLSGAARTSILYAIQGAATPSGSAQPSAGGTSGTPATSPASVAYLVFEDLYGSVWNPTGVTVQVCSGANVDSSGRGNNNNTAGGARANCVTCTSASCGAVGNGSPVPSVDPEAPSASCLGSSNCGPFILNQVRISYTFSPLIPGKIFNIPLQAFSGICSSSGTCTFTRQAEMRAMN